MPAPSPPSPPPPPADPAIPRSVTIARVLLAAQSAVWCGVGVLIAIASVGGQELGFLVVAGLLVALAGRGIWSATALRGLTERARTAGLVLGFFGLSVGVVLVAATQGFSLRCAGGLLLLAVNGAIIRGLDTARARAAFLATRIGLLSTAAGVIPALRPTPRLRDSAAQEAPRPPTGPARASRSRRRRACCWSARQPTGWRSPRRAPSRWRPRPPGRHRRPVQPPSSAGSSVPR